MSCLQSTYPVLKLFQILTSELAILHIFVKIYVPSDYVYFIAVMPTGNTCNWINPPPYKKLFVHLFQSSPVFQQCLCMVPDSLTQAEQSSVSVVWSCWCSLYVRLSTVWKHKNALLLQVFLNDSNTHFSAHMPDWCSMLQHTSLQKGKTLLTLIFKVGKLAKMGNRKLNLTQNLTCL